MKAETKKEMLKMLDFAKKETNFIAGKTRFQFRRATEDDIKHIESLETKKLIQEFNSIIGLTRVVQCFSIYDLQLEMMFALELSDRGYKDLVENAFEEAKAEHERFEENPEAFFDYEK